MAERGKEHVRSMRKVARRDFIGSSLAGGTAFALMPTIAAATGGNAARSIGSRRAQPFVTRRATEIGRRSIDYIATVEDFIVNNGAGTPAARLWVTSYVRSDVPDAAHRPLIFLFNGGPSFAAVGLHLNFGPLQAARDGTGSSGTPRFVANPDSLLDVADLIMFDPAETGFSRVLKDSDRPYFYSTDGDADSLAQLVAAWRRRHGRTESPLYFLGESYGSVRQVVAGSILAKKGLRLSGQIIFGESLFLTETYSDQAHNIIATAVSLPLFAMTAAYHGKVDRKGKTDPEFLDEVYAFALGDYLTALAKGFSLSSSDRQVMAARLAAYSGISAGYFAVHDLKILERDFNRTLLPGKLILAVDTRMTEQPLPPPPTNAKEAEEQEIGHVLEGVEPLYAAYMKTELHVHLPGIDYRIRAPGSTEHWNFGREHAVSSGLLNTSTADLLKSEFSDSGFRAMVVAGYYDGLSSIGMHRYEAAQMGYPRDRFTIHEYPAGHMTESDPVVRPRVAGDIREFLGNG